jgi:hypothetical protein
MGTVIQAQAAIRRHLRIGDCSCLARLDLPDQRPIPVTFLICVNAVA